jgi:hypothetical protein
VTEKLSILHNLHFQNLHTNIFYHENSKRALENEIYLETAGADPRKRTKLAIRLAVLGLSYCSLQKNGADAFFSERIFLMFISNNFHS